MAERNTQEREGAVFNFPLAADTVISKGRMVMLNAGEAVPASAIAAGVSVGIAQQTVEAVAGDTSVNAKQGTFLMANSTGADEIVTADVGSECFVADDQTVAKTDNAGARPVAGLIKQVEGSVVWVTFS